MSTKDAVSDLCEAISEALNSCRTNTDWLLELKETPDTAHPGEIATINLRKALILRDKLVAFIAQSRAP